MCSLTLQLFSNFSTIWTIVTATSLPSSPTTVPVVWKWAQWFPRTSQLHGWHMLCCRHVCKIIACPFLSPVIGFVPAFVFLGVVLTSSSPFSYPPNSKLDFILWKKKYERKTQCHWLQLFPEHTQIVKIPKSYVSIPVGFLWSRLDLLFSGILVLTKQVGAPTRGLHYPRERRNFAFGE